MVVLTHASLMLNLLTMCVIAVDQLQYLHFLVFVKVFRICWYCLQENAEADRDTKDESATNFLRFLMEGRWYVLEDLAIDEDTESQFYKQHPMFKHPLWPQYQMRVRALHDTPPCQLQQVGCYLESSS